MTYWAIKHFDHDWFFNVSTKRSEAIQSFIGLGVPWSWKYMYRQGYRAVKVNITVLDPAAPQRQRRVMSDDAGRL
jgi:hypothetical protein